MAVKLMLLLAVSAVIATTGSAQSKFKCKTSQVPPFPKNISGLHPAHVSFVAAFGDSITAAFAARGTPLEDRDLSWTIGVGADDQLTVPWLISQYAREMGTKEVDGSSLEKVLPKDIFHLPHDDYHPKTDRMNVAESEGAVHRGSLVEQWGFFLKQMEMRPNFNNPDKWKVVTLWMTANDVCGECNGPIDLTSWSSITNQWIQNVSMTMKNVYVNLMSTLDLSNVARIQRANVECDIEHRYILKECGCIDRGNASQLAQLDKNVHAMNAALHTLAGNWHKKLAESGRTDMAVTMQPFLEHQGSQFDRSFLSKLDCFHPSARSHEDLAIGMWNSMLCHDRQNLCNMSFSPDHMEPICPTVSSTFYTGPDVTPTPRPPSIRG